MSAYIVHARWHGHMELVSRDGVFYARSERTKRRDRLPLTDIDAAKLARTADEVVTGQPGGEWFDALLLVLA
jgi:hypothetical protein